MIMVVLPQHDLFSALVRVARESVVNQLSQEEPIHEKNSITLLGVHFVHR